MLDPPQNQIEWQAGPVFASHGEKTVVPDGSGMNRIGGGEDIRYPSQILDVDFMLGTPGAEALVPLPEAQAKSPRGREMLRDRTHLRQTPPSNLNILVLRRSCTDAFSLPPHSH